MDSAIPVALNSHLSVGLHALCEPKQMLGLACVLGPRDDAAGGIQCFVGPLLNVWPDKER